MSEPTLTPDPLREDLFLRGGARSLAPLRPVLHPLRALRDELIERLGAPESQALLLPCYVPYARHADPFPPEDLFLLMLRRVPSAALCPPLGARVLELCWPGDHVPKNPAILAEALALALGGPASDLTILLQRALQQRPLVLLHPTLRDDFDDEAPLRYFTAWLPEVLSKFRAQHPLHALQPLAIPLLSPLRRVAARAVAALWPDPPRVARAAVTARDAAVLCDRLLDPLRQRRALPLRALPPILCPRLGRADLHELGDLGDVDLTRAPAPGAAP